MNIFQLFIVQPIFNLLISIYSIIPGGDFGLAVIIFTLLVRFAMYPLVKRQLHQTKLMQKLQPELKRIKARSKGNRQLEGAAMMELYKKHDVSPFRSILILLIQLPIFLALFQVIQIFTLHRDEISKFTYDFLEKIPAISHLIAHPESFNEKLFGVIDLSKAAFSTNGINFFLVALAILAAATQYWMTRQTMPKQNSKKSLRQIMAEAADGKQADQSEINAAMMGKMSGILPFFMFFIMVTVPGVIALYYATSNIVAVAQQAYLLHGDEEELEDLADAPSKNNKAKKRAEQPIVAKTNTSQKSVKTKSREKNAKNATTITRITAKDTRKKEAK